MQRHQLIIASSLSLLLLSELSLASPVYVWRDSMPGVVANPSSPIAGSGSGGGETEPDIGEEDGEDDPSDQTSWEDYADAHYASYTDWNSLNWAGRGASHFPEAPYPLKEITGPLNFQSNGLVDMGGFRFVEKVATIDLRNNNLTNLDGLSGLKEADIIYANNNQLENIDGLSNLASINDIHLSNSTISNIDGLMGLRSARDIFLDNTQITNASGLLGLSSVRDLHLNNTNLTDVFGLSSLSSVRDLYLQNTSVTDLRGIDYINASGVININSWYNGPKLDASAPFCSDNDPSQFIGASWSQLCDAGPTS